MMNNVINDAYERLEGKVESFKRVIYHLINMKIIVNYST